MGFRDHLKLEEGYALHLINSRVKGTLSQTDMNSYEVVDALGNKVGTVEHVDTTEIKAPFTRSQHVLQRDLAGNKIVDFYW